MARTSGDTAGGCRARSGAVCSGSDIYRARIVEHGTVYSVWVLAVAYLKAAGAESLLAIASGQGGGGGRDRDWRWVAYHDGGQNHRI
ncbi:MAG: hypothetical protein Q9M48_07605 [Rhodobacterales bacterium]|nr:hypothetical protein [Rhodobacterales bacterium]